MVNVQIVKREGELTNERHRDSSSIDDLNRTTILTTLDEPEASSAINDLDLGGNNGAYLIHRSDRSPRSTSRASHRALSDTLRANFAFVSADRHKFDASLFGTRALSLDYHPPPTR